MPPVGFEPTISAGELPQNYALDSAATGTGERDRDRDRDRDRETFMIWKKKLAPLLYSVSHCFPDDFPRESLLTSKKITDTHILAHVTIQVRVIGIQNE